MFDTIWLTPNSNTHAWPTAEVAEVWSDVKRLISHIVPAANFVPDPRNQDDIRYQRWLRISLELNENYFAETESRFICANPWPYALWHIMIMYKPDPFVSELSQLSPEAKNELYWLLKYISNMMMEEFREELNSWDYSFFVWWNHSPVPWFQRAQSIDRKHIHFAVVREKWWEHDWITSEELSLYDPDQLIDNRSKVSLNRQNLSMMRDFKRFLSPSISSLVNESIIIPWLDESYGLDIKLPDWGIFSESWQEIISDTQEALVDYLKAVNGKETKYSAFVSQETRDAIDQANVHARVWDKINWIWFTISFIQINWKWHMRVKFAYKNQWEESWILEAGNWDVLNWLTKDTTGTNPPIDKERVRDLVRRNRYELEWIWTD